MKNVIEEIIAERKRQSIMEGFTTEHDDNHTTSQMRTAAGCYCLFGIGSTAPWHRPTFWPWDWRWWKPKDARGDLIKAGALIVAEIERLDRLEEKKEYITYTNKDGHGVCRRKDIQ